jgi:hypothetical protein
VKQDAGSATPTVLAILILLASALSGLALAVPASTSYERRSRLLEAERLRVDRAAAALLESLADDTTPEADSPFDPVWGLAAAGMDGVSLKLADVSSRLNLNYVRKKLLSETALEDLLAPGATPEALQQYREDTGLSTCLSHYKEFFPPDSERFLTCYGWANINITDEFVLRSLGLSLTGSEAKAEAFHGKVQALLAAKKNVAQTDLADFLGADADVLEPEIAAVPAWNVYFLDPFILEALLSYPAYEIKEPSKKMHSLLSARTGGALTEPQIAAILGVPATHDLLQYLGTRTWFWEIEAKTDRASLVLIAARDPRRGRSGEESRPRFIVIERRYE